MKLIEAYKTLSELNFQWDRIAKNKIIVYTHGYKTNDAHVLERFLMRAGMVLISQDFDSLCGKTKNTFLERRRGKHAT